MTKATNLQGEEIEYVEVRDEPLHRQQFETPHCRVYIAGIEPGEDTMWHRHSEDTIYTCLRSVEALNKPLDKEEFVHRAKQGDVWWTMSKAAPFVHQVCMLKDSAASWFFAVEVLEPPPIGAGEPLPAAAYKEDEGLAHSKARIYRLRLDPGQSTGTHTWGFYGLVLALSDGPGLTCESGDTGGGTAPFADGVLSKYGGWKWVEGPVVFGLTNAGPEPYEALVVEWKTA
ncbi:unnamed protein product [Phaeothamnion confervicola]